MISESLKTNTTLTKLGLDSDECLDGDEIEVEEEEEGIIW